MKKRLSLKIFIHLLIIVSWLGIMFLLIEKEGLIQFRTGGPSLRKAIPKDIVLDVWKGVYIKDRWIGYVHTMLGHDKETNNKGYIVHSFSYLRFKMFNKLTGLTVNTLQKLDSEYRLIDFVVKISGATNIIIKGERLGKKIFLDIHHNRNIYSKVFEAGDDFFLEQSILSIYRGKGLRPGDSYTLTILNPLTVSTEKIKLKVVDKDKDTTVMETKFAGLTSRSWINKNGLIVREETPNGWVMKLESEEKVNEHLRQSKGSTVDILKETSVHPTGKIAHPRQVKSLMIKVTGIDKNTFSLDGTRQKFLDSEKGIIKISSIFVDPEKATKLPCNRAKLSKFLEPSPWIDCQDSNIKAKAAEIINGERNSWLAAKKISGWVYKNVHKTFSPGIPIATSVLVNRKGDCNEHTALFIALARACGIPAETCTGLVYINDGFYYHAWPKVYVGKWVHLDPTLGQPVADATHFELISGDFSKQAGIAVAIGKIQIEILETEN
ncbi:MAG: transglutaminase domain-containing protein [Syntrophobacterales bacterium]|nr:transglutaminase domain-containing protein [Syntrophobacterales bacterium]